MKTSKIYFIELKEDNNFKLSLWHYILNDAYYRDELVTLNEFMLSTNDKIDKRKIKKGRNGSDIIRSIVEKSTWRLTACKGIHDKDRKRMCKKINLTQIISDLTTLSLTCRTQRCQMTMSNKINFYMQKLNELGE